MTVRSLVPWYRVRRSLPARRTDRLFDGFFNEFAGLTARPHGVFGETFTPRLDVSETEQEFKVVAELPGLDEKDIDVSFNQKVLTISGEKKSEQEEQGQNYHRIERSYGSFKRSVALPSEVDLDQIDASFSNGLLSITLPKTTDAQTKKIEVKAS